MLKSQYIVFIIFLITGIFANYSFSPKLFSDPYSSVIYDRDQLLLGAHIADDGQWRFPMSDSVPERFKNCILTFEDHRFYLHKAYDPLALIRATKLNLQYRDIVSGGSTITMQTIRLSRKGKARTIKEKIIEIYLALLLEQQHTKNEILNLYCSNAPFGGNTVGLKAAAWRYFGRSPHQLSWAENALLAVLPNSPSLIHPGKNRSKLIKKRNRLLQKLHLKNIIDSTSYELALLEPLPDKPRPFPQEAYHLLQRARKEYSNRESEFFSSIDYHIQKSINDLVIQHHTVLKGNDINNIAVLILDIDQGKTLGYVGNIPKFIQNEHGFLVDVITAPRSTGSILKPFLYCGMLTSGEILPNTLVPDVPTFFGGYYPKNFNLGYDGAVRAKRALARSLNIPAVKMLSQYGIERFHFLLQNIGLTTISESPAHYGLSLILGGADGSLWDICGTYASMARSLKTYTRNQSRYNAYDYHSPSYLFQQEYSEMELSDESILSAGAIWITFQAMLDVERPDEDNLWRQFASEQKIAWKTGTSFGFRDAWAIGLNPDFVVGVWAGNADGEGRPDLVGIKAAAPILFDVFKLLPKSEKWFDQPYDDMVYSATCKKSGFLPGIYCEEMDSIWIPQSSIRMNECPYHTLIHLDQTKQYQVTDQCYSPHEMIHASWFILPPVMEWYYKKHNASYQTIPPMHPECMTREQEISSMQIIYPNNLAKIYVPIEIDGTPGKSVFEVAHRNDTAAIFWYVDDTFIGTTTNLHQMALKPESGEHTLTLIDNQGEILIRKFEILNE